MAFLTVFSAAVFYLEVLPFVGTGKAVIVVSKVPSILNAEITGDHEMSHH
jgi:hypothetical protein